MKNKFKETVGQTLNVLTEKNSFGYSENYLKVKISSKKYLKEGQIIPVKITGYNPNYLEATI
jgi:tRNA A37 methylthiotransferase MiaB